MNESDCLVIDSLALSITIFISLCQIKRHMTEFHYWFNFISLVI
jgi:hypothetical protein